MIGGIDHGPEGAKSGFARDDAALLQILTQKFKDQNKNVGMTFGFFLETWGSIQPELCPETKLGRIHASKSKSHVGITIYLSRDFLYSNEFERREMFAKLIVEGIQRMCANMKKKHPNFDSGNWESIVQSAVDEYLKLPSPLPVSGGEEFWETVEQKGLLANRIK